MRIAKSDQGFRPFVTKRKRNGFNVGNMRKLASLVKGYTLGTVFVLVHVATHELRSRQLPR